MAASAIARRRLSQQRLSHNPFHTPCEVVAWLGAVIIELAPFAPLTAAEDTAVAAAQRYGDFVGMPVHLAHNV